MRAELAHASYGKRWENVVKPFPLPVHYEYLCCSFLPPAVAYVLVRTSTVGTVVVLHLLFSFLFFSFLLYFIFVFCADNQHKRRKREEEVKGPHCQQPGHKATMKSFAIASLSAFLTLSLGRTSQSAIPCLSPEKQRAALADTSSCNSVEDLAKMGLDYDL